MITTKKMKSPEVMAEEKPVLKMEDLLARIEILEKKAGGYDDGYGAPKDPTPEPKPQKVVEKEEDAVPGVPGTHAEGGGEEDEPEKKDGYGVGYVAPRSEAKDDDDDDDEEEDDGEECMCSKCGSKYKAKKVAKKEEDEDEDAMPKKAERSFDTGRVLELQKPTVEELQKAKYIKVNKNEIMGIRKKETSNSVGRQMNAAVMNSIGLGIIPQAKNSNQTVIKLGK